MYYENVFIVNPDISQGNTEEFTDGLVSRVEKAGGRIVKREYWGVRPLAYSIAKRKRGHYTLLVIDGEPDAARALELALSLDESVLRFMTTRLNELSDAPSPLMRGRVGAAESEKAEAEDESASEAVDPSAKAAAPEEGNIPEDTTQKEATTTATDKVGDVVPEEKGAEG